VIPWAAAVLLCLSLAIMPANAQQQVAPPADLSSAQQRLEQMARQAADAPSETDAPAVEAELADDAEVSQREATPLGGSAAANDQQPLGESESKGYVRSTLTALGIVIGLVLLLRWGLSRFGGMRIAKPSPVVEVLSRTTVAPRNHVLLLRVGQRVLVVGDSSAGLRTLADVDDPDEVAVLLQSVTAERGDGVTRTFQNILDHEDQQHADLQAGIDSDDPLIGQTRSSLSVLAGRFRLAGRGGDA
jgi:flagellar biogenesis protein FliO